ncbi:MAG: DivIVA domain-containing protein, partial [bacterium]|nr:DivIVA domain-containing protein [bacterium]
MANHHGGGERQLLMPLTPLDVDNLKLRSVLRGYDRSEVDQFRAEVIGTIEEYIDMLGRLKLRVRELESELTRYRELEEQVKNSVMFAQRTADEHIAAARERAAALVEQARLEAQELRRDVAVVIAQREQFEYQFHGLLTGFLQRLEQHNPKLDSRAAGKAEQATQPVLSNMDTQHTPEGDIQIDMEDLTIEPLDQIAPQPPSDTVVLSMAQATSQVSTQPDPARHI